MMTLNDGRDELWQWDTGRTLSVDADCSQVHFSNKVFGRSIDVDVVDGVAVIPDILLQTDKDLNVWAFVGAAENGYTKISKIFTVNRRNKPDDYVYTPTDQMTLHTIQSQIGDLSDLTTEAKDTLVAAINEAARTGGGAGSMELRVADGYVQYSADGGMTWTNLISMADLEGADGITPHIGDNGNWYLGATDTGKPSRGATGSPGKDGADGAPGKDGAGMDVTGATVGQIAKIAAVDASGVPTAWSPADMPSGGSPDALLYTPQTLTDAQKKQARENIDATASDFVINATVASDNTCTTDKTYAQIQEAIQDGKRAVMKARLSGTDFILPQVGKFLGYYAFAAVLNLASNVAMQYTIMVGAQDSGVISCRVVTYDTDGNLQQVTMGSDPTEDMEIATKQYVDASGVPSVTAADNGKFLRVVNGAWAAATINDANGVSF